MIKQLAALALTGSVLLGSASVAVAQKVKQQPFNEAGVNFLLRTVTETGHSTYSGGEWCDTQRAYGFATANKQLVICVDNHGNDMDELADTVRHEAFHLAQYCKARRVGASMALIFPEAVDDSMALARDLGMPMQRYDQAQYAFEAEARAAAFALNERQIAAVLKEECRYD